MKLRIWRLATVGVLCVSVSGQVLADDSRGNDNNQPPHGNNGQQRGHQEQGANNQARPEHEQGRGQGNQGNQPREQHNSPNQGRGEQQAGQWQARPQQETHGQGQGHSAAPANNLPIQPRPNAVQQTHSPNPGGNQSWQTGGSNQGGNQNWHTGDSNPRPGYYPGASNNSSHPRDQNWAGRPSGHGNGWGSGPQYRPGYMVDRFPDKHWQVPYRGQNYFFSGGYWYRPQGPRYVVVRPPYGIRVGYLPDYAQELWIGSTLLFLAAGAYYQYQPATQDYIVVQPPPAAPQPVSNGYDVVAYPVNGQSPEQVNQDGYECYRWAVSQSGFDPAKATYAPSPAVVQAYRQAQGSCLSSRGYQVTY